MLIDQTLTDFARQTADKTPSPGGGAVAAYVGCLGAALGLMSARFTEGRKGFEQHAEALGHEIDRLEALRIQMLELVDADASAYDGVTAAYKLPRGTDEEQADRRLAIQRALVTAMDTPLRTCRLCAEALLVLEDLRHHTNPNLVSDVAVAAYAFGATYRSAWVNVLINLAGIHDEDLKQGVLAEGQELLARVDALEVGIGAAITGSLLP